MPFEGGGPTESRLHVREAVEAQLVKKGLVITTDYPDVIVEGKITEWSGWFDKKDFWNATTTRERRIISMVVSARTQDDIVLTSVKFDQGTNKQDLDSSTSGESPEKIGSKMGKRLADKLMKKSLQQYSNLQAENIRVKGFLEAIGSILKHDIRNHL